MNVAIEEYELYNNGILLCKWFDLKETELSEIKEYVKKAKITNGLNGEDLELFIADTESDLLKNIESVNQAFEIKEAISELDEEELKALALIIDNGLATDLKDSISKVEDMANTGYSSIADYAENLLEETGGLDSMPENLKGYFDYEKFANDLEIEGSFFEDDNGEIWEYRG